MRSTFVGSYRFMTCDHYRTHQMPLCEIKLNQILSRKHTLTISLDTNLPHPMININSHIPKHQQGENQDLK